MSFAGISFFEGKMIAFADSKSTSFVNGMPCHDTERGEVKKILKNDVFICTATGTNQVAYQKDGLYLLENLEGIVERILTDGMSPFTFCSRLYLFLNDKKSILGAEIYFVFGYLKKCDNAVIPASAHVNLTKEGISFEERMHIWNSVEFSGNSSYTDYFNQNTHLLLGSQEGIKKAIEDTVRSFDRLGGYNPVGLPICTEVFIPEAHI